MYELLGNSSPLTIKMVEKKSQQSFKKTVKTGLRKHWLPQEGRKTVL